MLAINRILLVCAGLLIGLFAGRLNAQSSNGYVFFAPGGETCCGATYMTLQFGVGGEAVLKKGIGVGAELGALAFRDDFAGTVLGVLSPNGYYHFRHGRGVRVDPFVTAGYSLLFRTGHANYANYGGGVTYWFHPRLGARLEFRDQINTLGTIEHFWGVRFGLAFH